MFSVVSLMIFLLFFLHHLSNGQQFFLFQSKAYFIEKNKSVTSYLEAYESCRNKNAEMAVVNSQKIQDFLVEKINLAELRGMY